jgi:hypothetical protein
MILKVVTSNFQSVRAFILAWTVVGFVSRREVYIIGEDEISHGCAVSCREAREMGARIRDLRHLIFDEGFQMFGNSFNFASFKLGKLQK